MVLRKINSTVGKRKGSTRKSQFSFRFFPGLSDAPVSHRPVNGNVRLPALFIN
jgi:hypothetical protein